MTLVIMKVVMKSCYAMCLSCYVIYALCHNQALKCSCGECWAPKKHSGFSTLKMGATTNYKLQRQTTTTHNYIKHNDTQHRGFISIIQHNDTEHNNIRPTCWMSLYWVSRLIHFYVECHYAECRYAECWGALKFVRANTILFQRQIKRKKRNIDTKHYITFLIITDGDKNRLDFVFLARFCRVVAYVLVRLDLLHLLGIAQ